MPPVRSPGMGRKGGSLIVDPRMKNNGGGSFGGSTIRDPRAPALVGKRVGRLILTRTLGEGAYGKVKLGTDYVTREQYAVKILARSRLKENGMLESLNREIGVLKRLKHRNVVALHDVLGSASKVYLVMELVAGGEVFERLASIGHFSEATARAYFAQLIDGVAYLHSQGVAHRDLKPENLLLSSDNVLKITDFDLSTLMEDANGSEAMLDTACGTLNYMAPEVLEKKAYRGNAADIWSCGVILYVFLVGYLPFDDERVPELTRLIVSAEYSVPVWVSPLALDLIDRMLQPDPAARITLPEIRAHPWLRSDASASSDSGSDGASSSSRFLDAPPPLPDGPIANSTPRLVSSIEQVDDEDPSGLSTSGGAPGLPSLTAFELLVMTRALDYSRLLDTSKTDLERQGRRLQGRTNFIVDAPDADMVLARVRDAMSDIFYPKVSFDVDESRYLFSVRVRSNVATVSLKVQLYRVSDTLILVHFDRQAGDTFAMHKFFVKVRDKITRGKNTAKLDANGSIMNIQHSGPKSPR